MTLPSCFRPHSVLGISALLSLASCLRLTVDEKKNFMQNWNFDHNILRLMNAYVLWTTISGVQIESLGTCTASRPSKSSGFHVKRGSVQF